MRASIEATAQVTPDASNGYDDRFSIFSIGSLNSCARTPFTVDSKESWIPPTVMERHIASKARSFFHNGQFYCSVSDNCLREFCSQRLTKGSLGESEGLGTRMMARFLDMFCTFSSSSWSSVAVPGTCAEVSPACGSRIPRPIIGTKRPNVLMGRSSIQRMRKVE